MTTAAFRTVLLRLASESTSFKSKAFLAAAKELETYHDPDLTVEKAMCLHGFGKGILKRLDDFLREGKVEEDKEAKVLKLFRGIYGVGPVIAKRFYDKGKRTLADISLEELTPAQKLGLQYYDDINSPIPREEIVKFDEILKNMFICYTNETKHPIKYQICGSYRRGKATSGDIDVIVTEAPGFIQFLYPYVEFVLAHGSRKILCLGGLPGGPRRRIDFELVTETNWPYASLYFTGSQTFNIMMRGKAKEQGLLLNHEGLFSETEQFLVEDESAIFMLLGLDYTPPEKR